MYPNLIYINLIAHVCCKKIYIYIHIELLTSWFLQALLSPFLKPSLNMHGSWQQPQGRGAGRGVYGPGGKAGENGWQRKQHCMEANYSSIGHRST